MTNNPVVNQLIDSLTNSLTQLVVKLEACSKSLEGIEHDIDQLDELTITFKETLDHVNNNTIQLEKLKIALTRPQTPDGMVTIFGEVQNIKKDIKPVSKLSNLISKPLAFILILITLAGSLLWIQELIKKYSINNLHPYIFERVHTNYIFETIHTNNVINNLKGIKSE